VNNEQYNTIEIEKSRVRVREANCPEQVDVKQGWLTRPGQSAVCLPHRLVLKLVSSGAPDEVDEIVR
ncbi:MAG: NusG domain II-containing protein, partial [Bacillota bacterium]